MRPGILTTQSPAFDIPIGEALEPVPRHDLQLNARRNLLMLWELLEILDLFTEQGIRALPYKGPVLAAIEYGNLAARTFCDLDILVRKEDATRARDLLVARGYVREHHL